MENPYESPRTPPSVNSGRLLVRWALLIFWIIATFGCYLAMAIFNRGRSDSDFDPRSLFDMMGLLVCVLAACFQVLFIAGCWIWREIKKQRQAEQLASLNVDKTKIPKISRQR
jgi:hypothetical protein